MFKKLTLSCILTLLTVSAFSIDNKVLLGIKGGMNLSTYSGDGVNMDSKFGFNAGVTIDFAITDKFYILSGLELTTKGGKKEFIDGGIFGEEYANKPIKFTMNPMYLQLPLHVAYKYEMADDLRIMIEAGPYFAYGVSGKATVKYDGKKEKANIFGTSDYDLNFRRFDFGLGLGAGLEYDRVGIKVGYDFGLVKIKEGAEAKNGNFYVALGYHF